MNWLLKIRIVRAIKHTGAGLKALWQYEQAFRQEIYLGLFLGFMLTMMTVAIWIKLLLISLLLFLLVVEALNSALEAVVDRISLEIHPQSKIAKDMGSAAVGITIIINIIAWAWSIHLQFFA
jgi:diacylglycerol kinase (ATP)